MPALGAHGLVYARNAVAVPSLTVSPLAMQPTGSSLLVCVGRGVVSAHQLPADNQGNVFTQVGTAHTYTQWPSSGTALYACLPAVGRTDHAVTVGKALTDETTLSVVEIRNGGVVSDVRWREALSGTALTSATVTTTGPALLVAWWWGDADEPNDKTAVPNNGFTVIDSILLQGALVQCAVAVREVAAAGSYNVTWTSTPQQGAQLWIAAVQRA